jgi:hypothetical protein
MDKIDQKKIISPGLNLLHELAIWTHISSFHASDSIGTIRCHRTEVNIRSAAKASPSLQAITSAISGSVIPSRTTPEAPRKMSVGSWAIAATDALLRFVEIAASTFTFMQSAGGGNYRGL